MGLDFWALSRLNRRRFYEETTPKAEQELAEAGFVDHSCHTKCAWSSRHGAGGIRWRTAAGDGDFTGSRNRVAISNAVERRNDHARRNSGGARYPNRVAQLHGVRREQHSHAEIQRPRSSRKQFRCRAIRDRHVCRRGAVHRHDVSRPVALRRGSHRVFARPAGDAFWCRCGTGWYREYPDAPTGN